MTAGTLVEELHLSGAALWPEADAGLDLGTSALGFNDLHLGSGGVVNFDGGDVTLTHSSGTLTYGGDGTVSVAFGANVDLAFTGGSTENEIVLTNALADALSITDGSADVLVISTAGSTNTVTITGDLSVTGDTTTVSTTNTIVTDALIELNTGAGSNSNDMGIVMERGSTGDNAIIAWDESADVFTVGTTTATGASTGNLTITAAAFTAGAISGTTGTFSTDVSVGDDLSLTSDSAVFNMGDGSDFTITHDGTTGATIAATPLTVTSATAATWSTSAGALTLNGTGGLVLQEGGAAIIGISDTRVIATTNTASVDLDASGAIQINSTGGALSIGNDNIDQTVNIATAGTRTLNIGIGDGTDVTTTIVKGTLSVGVDDTGYDVKFFGASAGAYMEWDESADELRIMGASADAPIILN